MVKLENALQEIEELKWKNKGLEEQLRVAAAGCEVGRRRQDRSAECLVLEDSIIRNVKSEHISIQCFRGIRTEQSCGKQGALIPSHVGTNDLRQTVNVAKTKFPQSKFKRDITWRHIRALNARYDSTAKSLGV
jgi:hypothetical protein